MSLIGSLLRKSTAESERRNQPGLHCADHKFVMVSDREEEPIPVVCIAEKWLKQTISGKLS